LCEGLFQGTPRVFKNALEKIRLAADFQNKQLPDLAVQLPGSNLCKKRFPKIPAAEIFQGRVRFFTRRRFAKKWLAPWGLLG
jgi:hypothetical protein